MRNLVFRLIFIALVFPACEVQGPDEIEDLDVVISIHSNNPELPNLSTYRIADDVVNLGDSTASLPADLNNGIVNAFRMQLNGLGWQEIDQTDSATVADVVVLISALKSENLIIIDDWWNYWDYWYGWDYYYPGFGGWYPSYPGYPGICCYSNVYAYTEGTLLAEMLDTRAFRNTTEAPESLNVIWGGMINGLLMDEPSIYTNRVENSINQLFIDSPYLNRQ